VRKWLALGARWRNIFLDISTERTERLKFRVNLGTKPLGVDSVWPLRLTSDGLPTALLIVLVRAPNLVEGGGLSGIYARVKRLVRKLPGSAVSEAGVVIEAAAGEETRSIMDAGPMARNPKTGKHQRTRLCLLTLDQWEEYLVTGRQIFQPDISR
jgi:hypothetical protein